MLLKRILIVTAGMSVCFSSTSLNNNHLYREHLYQVQAQVQGQQCGFIFCAKMSSQKKKEGYSNLRETRFTIQRKTTWNRISSM